MKHLCNFLITFLLLLTGCTTPLRLASGNASLLLTPKVQAGRVSQAVVPPYTRNSINHLVLALFTYSGETEASTSISKDLLNAQLDNPVVFSNLKPSTTYRVRAYAYKAPGTDPLDLISNTNSYTDVTLGQDDRPIIGAIPVNLVDKSFNGQATSSLSLTPGGYSPIGLETLDLPPFLISSVAGNYDVNAYNVPATSASLSNVNGVCVDSGMLYFADYNNHRIRKVDLSTGKISTVAGSGTQGFGGDNGAATSASLYCPRGVCVDSGKLYISDRINHRIRRVDLGTGIISTVAGNGTAGAAGDGGAATSANLNNPYGVCVDSGKLYIADTGNHLIRMVDFSTGKISTVAGNGTGIFAGDGGAATSASLNGPSGVCVASGMLYIADTGNNRIRMLNFSSGNISTVAGGIAGFGGDGGAATSASLNGPTSVCVASSLLYISDTNNRRVRMVDFSTGKISTVAGNGTATFAGDGGAATNASINNPYGVCVGSGMLYIADYNNRRIRRVDLASGNIATAVGNGGTPGFAGDGGVATNASLNSPYGVCWDSGILYIADTLNHRIRRVDLNSGIISTVAGNGTPGFGGDTGAATSASLNSPYGVCVTSGMLYIADTLNHRIRQVDLNSGLISTVAGNGTGGFGGDGEAATSANLNSPNGVCVASGKLYVADTLNHRIRQVDLGSGIISTVAGTTQGFGGDAGAATSAQLSSPNGVCLDTRMLYIADTCNQRIRRVNLDSGIISTVAGNGSAGSTGDGEAATSASLNTPSRVCVDSGKLYIADTGNHRIRRVYLSSGIVSTVAGNGTGTFAGDGGLATSANLYSPYGVCVAPGVLYIADYGNHRIRRLY